MKDPYQFTMAHYPDRAGFTAWDTGCPFTTVTAVPYDQPADIVFIKYTADYSRMNARPYKLAASGRQFASIKSAVAALKKERGLG